MSESLKRTVITLREGEALRFEGAVQRVEVLRFVDHRVRLAVVAPPNVEVVREARNG